VTPDAHVHARAGLAVCFSPVAAECGILYTSAYHKRLCGFSSDYGKEPFSRVLLIRGRRADGVEFVNPGTYGK